MNKFTPVLIPTLDRYNHLKRCIESLSKCKHADKTELYIALDYPAKESHWRGYKRIKQYLNQIRGFKKTIIIKRQNNFGALENITAGRREVFEKHNCIIFSEDDNEFSPNFLEYINIGLTKYENNDKISAICGYSYPLQYQLNNEVNNFLYRGLSAWGYGTWKHKFSKPFYSHEELKLFAKNSAYINELNNISERHYFNLATSILKRKERYGDFTVMLNNIKHDQYCIFPTISKVRNHGHDGSGLNCETNKSHSFFQQQIDTSGSFQYTEINDSFNNETRKVIRKYFRLTNKQKLLYPIVLLILKILLIKQNVLKTKITNS